MDSVNDKVRLSHQRSNIMLNFREVDRRLTSLNFAKYMSSLSESINLCNARDRIVGDLKWSYFLNTHLIEELD